MELTLAYVGACGGPRRDWRERWLALAAEQRAERTGAGLAAAVPPPATRAKGTPDRGHVGLVEPPRARRALPVAAAAIAAATAWTLLRLAAAGQSRRHRPSRLALTPRARPT